MARFILPRVENSALREEGLVAPNMGTTLQHPGAGSTPISRRQPVSLPGYLYIGKIAKPPHPKIAKDAES